MKKILAFTVLLTLFFSIYAQEQGNNDFLKHRVTINLGSSVWGTMTNLFVKGPYVDKAYAIPNIGVEYEYAYEKNIGIGANLNYQNYYYSLLPIDTSHTALKANINRINIGVHANAYLLKKANFDIYGGSLISLNIWTGNVSFDQARDYIKEIISFDMLANKIIDILVPSDQNLFLTNMGMQFYLGADYYFNKNLGIKGEFAMGSPYWFRLGVNYKFNFANNERAHQ